MEQLLLIAAGLIGMVIVWKALAGIFKLVGIGLVVVIIAALYFGAL